MSANRADRRAVVLVLAVISLTTIHAAGYAQVAPLVTPPQSVLDIASKMGLDPNAAGVVVADVEPGSPALEAGLRPGDVLVRISGNTVTSASQAEGTITSMKRGDTATFVVLRQHTRMLLRVPIE